MPYSRDNLVAALREYGITYLAPSDAKQEQAISAEDLIVAILNQPDDRLKLALVSLFIRNPHLVETVQQLEAKLSASLLLDLKTLYMAAVYLQRFWFIQLGLYLDDMSLLPDLYSQQLNLPPADERFGKVGLYALADDWTTRSPYPFNWLASLQKNMDLFLASLKLENPLRESAPVS